MPLSVDHPFATTRSERTARRARQELRAAYLNEEAARLRGHAAALLAWARAALHPDFLLLEGRTRSDRERFLAALGREASLSHPRGVAAPRECRLDLAGLRVRGDTAVADVATRAVAPAGPDGLSGPPQPVTVVTVLRYHDLWLRDGGAWRLRRRERRSGGSENGFYHD